MGESHGLVTLSGLSMTSPCDSRLPLLGKARSQGFNP